MCVNMSLIIISLAKITRFVSIPDKNSLKVDTGWSSLKPSSLLKLSEPTIIFSYLNGSPQSSARHAFRYLSCEMTNSAPFIWCLIWSVSCFFTQIFNFYQRRGTEWEGYFWCFEDMSLFCRENRIFGCFCGLCAVCTIALSDHIDRLILQ